MISWPLIVAGSTFSIGLLQFANGVSEAWVTPVAQKLVQGHPGAPRYQHHALLRGIIMCGICMLLTYALVTQVEGIHIFLAQQTNARANLLGFTDKELRLHDMLTRKRRSL